MKEKEIKLTIQSAIKSFASGNLSEQSIALFKTLGYNTERQNPFSKKTFTFFKESFLDGDSRFNENKALTKEWKSVDLLFQLTRDEVTNQKSLFDIKKVDNTIIETYLFFALELTKAEYTRTTLAQVTREINKVFPMPVLIVFKYGEHLTLAVINRRLNKKDEQRDVLEKVTLIKDISIANPHRAHIEILFDLSFAEIERVHKVSNFVELHNAWQKTLDSKELNNRFYRELSNWFFWALKSVSFPNDVDNDKDNTVFNSESIIRLLTRLIFIWFIKEKNLIPDKIFDEKEISKLIKGFKKEGSTVYYRAILQNLFFATLNQKMEERAFATDGTFEQNKKNYGIKNLYRYSSDFAISKSEVIKLFESVPFLNGGLFDCLDSEDKSGKVMYLDGFSRNLKKQARVPDELFFSQEKNIDLSSVYDDKKKKNETVKGLFEIFNQYKFTITENTPIEEEVALDPELLGRVFENLLASYNPETKTTARKQTGSFYTPREIVNYMVDESLKAYFKQKLETKACMKAEDAEIGLEILHGYYEKEHLFNKKQTTVLINAIDECKILDPACGSGAFPMGILHKLVHILHKLDPKNEQWKERQIQKAIAIDDATIREHSIEDIESAFENNELDYGRKLYLIENCIYGIDIQPIAVQIAKLRFFISLVVDQKKHEGRDNLGIRSLPNLETKIVAANTLIGLEKPAKQMSLFENKDISILEDKLKELRHRYFSVKTRKDKLNCQNEDKVLREKIAKHLEQGGWKHQSAMQIVAFDPYNQNVTSPFFEPEWMFGLKGILENSNVFDVIIGNPPYIRIQELESEFVTLLKSNYAAATGKFDIYVCFIEKAISMLKQNGFLCYINSNKFLRSTYGFGIRKLISNSQNLVSILDFGDSQQFEHATTYTCILILSRIPNKTIKIYQIDDIFDEIAFPRQKKKSGFQLLPHPANAEPWIFEDSRALAIISNASKFKSLGTCCDEIFQGIISGGDKLFYLKKIKKTKSTVICKSSIDNCEYELENDICYDLLKGSEIKRYASLESRNIVLFPYKVANDGGTIIIEEAMLKQDFPLAYSYLSRFKHELSSRGSERMEYEAWYSLWCPRTLLKLKSPKILTQVLASKASYSLDANGDMFFTGGGNAGVYGIIPQKGMDLKFLLGILNSRYHDFLLKKTSTVFRGGYFSYAKRFIERLPCLNLSNHEQRIIANLVTDILTAKRADPNYNTSVLENKVDMEVYKLFNLLDSEISFIEQSANPS